MIVGIDEVGRGPWAGPLVMGAVVLGCEIDGLTDSKKLTKKRREELNEIILGKAAAVGIGWISAEELDEMGMSAALTQCCLRALRQIKVPFHEIIIDGTVNLLQGSTLQDYVTTMKKADLLVPSVSAASIVAKVARDRYMAEQDEAYKGYNFKSHAGYGTAAHRAAIEKHGITPLHRKSFAPIAKYVDKANAIPAQKQPRIRQVFSSLSSRLSAELPSVGRKDWSSTSREEIAKKTGNPRNASDQVSHLPSTTKKIGDASETAAAEELVRRGHEIIARNWKTKYCEIDIITKKDDTYYFVEVKHRKNARSGDGLAAITPKKLNQMKFAAKFYAHSEKLNGFNLQLLAIATTGDPPQIESVVKIE